MAGTWERVARITVAAVGVVGAVAGVATGNAALAAAGVGLAGWASPWVREVQLDRGLQQAMQLLEALRHEAHRSGPPVAPQELDKAMQRLRRVSKPPPVRGK